MAFAYQLPDNFSASALPTSVIAPSIMQGQRIVQQPQEFAAQLKNQQLSNALQEAMNPYKIAAAKREEELASFIQQLQTQQIKDQIANYPIMAKKALTDAGITVATPGQNGAPSSLPALTPDNGLSDYIENLNNTKVPDTANRIAQKGGGGFTPNRSMTDEEIQNAVQNKYPAPRIVEAGNATYNATAAGAGEDKKLKQKHAYDMELAGVKGSDALDRAIQSANLNNEEKDRLLKSKQEWDTKAIERKGELAKDRLQTEIDSKSQLVKEKAAQSLPPAQAKAAQKATDSIRLDPNIKEYWTVGKEFSVMKAALSTAQQTGNYAGVDQAIMNQINRMENPRSIVRQSSMNVTRQETSLWDSVIGKMEQWQRGGEANITDAERANFLNLGTKYEKVAKGSAASAIIPYYNNLTRDQGIAADRYLSPDLLALLPSVEASAGASSAPSATPASRVRPGGPPSAKVPDAGATPSAPKIQPGKEPGSIIINGKTVKAHWED